VQLDVRFVPEDQTFEGRAVRDTANAMPNNYGEDDNEEEEEEEEEDDSGVGHRQRHAQQLR
jgi:hypothetical protein